MGRYLSPNTRKVSNPAGKLERGLKGNLKNVDLNQYFEIVKKL